MVLFGQKTKVYILAALMLSSVLIWHAVFEESPKSILAVSVLDIGQGDAIFIESPEKIQVMVDGGPGKAVLRAISKSMPFYDRSIDLLIISNPDKDHIGGFVDILKKYKVGAILVPGTQTDTATYKALLETAATKNVHLVEGRRGQVVNLGGGAYIEILFPDRDPSGLDTNTGSLVAKLIYGESSMLLTGDTTSGVENYLIRIDGGKLKSQVLKVAHHGSKTSSDKAFVGMVSPQYAAISSGEGNSYGHPNAETIETLNQFGVKILRTDELGTIKFVSNGRQFQAINK